MSAFDALLAKSPSSVTLKPTSSGRSAFDSLLNSPSTKQKQQAKVKVLAHPELHPFNPLNPNNQLNKFPVNQVHAKSFFGQSLLETVKKLPQQVTGAVKDTFQIPTAIVKSEFQPSETQKQIERLSGNDILAKIARPITRAAEPIVEGLGTQIGGIFASNIESKQITNAKPTRVGKQVQPTVQTSATGKITANDILDTILNTSSVVLALSPIIGRMSNKAALSFTDMISKNSRVPITYSDMQAITRATSDAEAISKVGQEKFDAFKEATRTDQVKSSLKQGYIELAKKEPNKFVNLVKNAATRPLSEIGQFTKEYGAPVKTTTPLQIPRNASEVQIPKVEGTPTALATTEKGFPVQSTLPKPIVKPTTTPAKIEGQAPSKIAKSIETKAIENKLTQGFEGLAGYDKITIADQAEKAAKLFTNTDEAMQVIRGEKTLPEGLRGTAVIIAAEEHIAKTGDARMAYELANSPLVSETSAAAQEMRLAAERQPDSITKKLQEIKQAREQAAVKKYGNKAKADTIKEIKSEVKKSVPKAKDWASFLEEIKC